MIVMNDGFKSEHIPWNAESAYTTILACSDVSAIYAFMSDVVSVVRIYDHDATDDPLHIHGWMVI